MPVAQLSQRLTWGLRGVSLVIILVLWEWYGRRTNPILFTYPTAIARAALDMLADGSLLTALGQSLYVLAVGFMVVLLFTIFPVLINTMRGIREVDPRLVEVAHAFCSNEYRLWLDLILPSALPFVMTGLRLAIGRGLIAVIVAEFYTAISGLGYLIVSNAHTF